MKKTVSLIILVLLTLQSIGSGFPEPMRPARLVNDFTALFSPAQNRTLERKLREFNTRTSTQIVIATVPDLDGHAPNDYAQRLAEKWQIGQKGKDNGILVLIQPKTHRTRGQVAIAVGYGLEGVIPDATASRIIRSEILPAFRQGDYYAGIARASDILIRLSEGEFTAEEYSRKGRSGNLIFLPFLVFFFLPLFLRRRRGYTASSSNATFPPIFFGGFGSSRNDFNSFSGGSGSFGGFEGFGGGSFGGGGASGSW